MALFPVSVFTKENVKCRWRETFTSESVNKKFLGIPKGVYLGFEPQADPGDPINILDLNLDSIESVSVLRCKSTASQTAVDLIVEAQVQLDFTGHVVFPVYVYAEVNYQVGLETTAEIKSSSTPPNGLDQIGICKITAPNIGGSTLGVDHLQFDPANAPDRHAPIANTGIPFGFMTGGAEQDRQRAVLTSDEVDAAREDTVSFTHPLLQARLTADFAPARIAANQGKSIETIRSNDHTEVTGSSLNVSHSFGTPSRTSQPSQDIGGGGSESLNGAICEVTAAVDPATSDLIRNLVAIQEIASGRPYVDPSTGRPVFGRLKFDEVDFNAGAPVDATTILTFTNGNPVVTRSVGTTDLTTVYSAGDLLKDPDGNYYPVLSVVAAAVTLSVAWVAATLLVTQTIQRRRFTVDFFTRNLGAETAYSVVRTCIVQQLSWSSPTASLGVLAPTTPETFAATPPASSVGDIVAQAYAPTDRILYVPTDPAVVITTAQLITGGLGATVTAVAGTPTIDAPDLRFFFNVFQDISESRSNELLDYLQSPHPEVPRATEIIDGFTRFGPHLGLERFEALQTSDPRILTQDEKDAATNASAPSAANPFVTDSGAALFDLTSKAAAFGRWAKTGEFVAGGPARTVILFGFEDSDNHPTQPFSVAILGAGIITLTRPPTGILYIYTVEFIGFAANVAGTSVNFQISATSSTLPISNTAQEGNVNGEWNGTANVKAHFPVDSVAAGGLLNNLIEIQRRAGANTTSPTNSTSKLLISRVARVE
jgi:hypothetical protein